MKRLLLISTLAAAFIGLLIGAAPSLAYTASRISAVAGTPLPSSTVVATFSDGIDLFGCNASVFQATANWGDGSGVQPATVTGPANPEMFGACKYSVSAAHVYSLPGSYTLTVNVTGAGNPGSAKGTVTVADVPILAGPGTSVSGVAGQDISGIAGTFTTANTLAPVSYYSATIDWGDGSDTSATVIAGAHPGDISVAAQHVYALPGDYVATVRLADGDGETSSLQDVFAISDAGLQSGASLSLSGHEDEPLKGTVAQFSTPDTAAPASFYKATIQWGDGTSSAGKVVAKKTPGDFVVDGSHSYARGGTANIIVTVTDGANKTITMDESVTINLLTGQLSPVDAPTIHAQPGYKFSGPVIYLGYRGGSAKDLSATVDWADGQSSNGNVIELGSSPIYGDIYEVVADHTYVASAYYAVRVTVRATDGKVLTVPVTIAAEVDPVPQFALHLRNPRFSPGVLAVTLTCPKGETLCRGFLSAAVKVRGVVNVLAVSYFIVPGGDSATINLSISDSQLKQLHIRGLTKITVGAFVTDPAQDKRSTAKLVITHRFPG